MLRHQFCHVLNSLSFFLFAIPKLLLIRVVSFYEAFKLSALKILQLSHRFLIKLLLKVHATFLWRGSFYDIHHGLFPAVSWTRVVLFHSIFLVFNQRIMPQWKAGHLFCLLRELLDLVFWWRCVWVHVVFVATTSSLLPRIQNVIDFEFLLSRFVKRIVQVSSRSTVFIDSRFSSRTQTAFVGSEHDITIQAEFYSYLLTSWIQHLQLNIKALIVVLHLIQQIHLKLNRSQNLLSFRIMNLQSRRPHLQSSFLGIMIQR